jgi:hypothetical protein
MFLGMSFCLPLAFIVERRQRRQAQKTVVEGMEEPLLANGVSELRGWMVFWKFVGVSQEPYRPAALLYLNSPLAT